MNMQIKITLSQDELRDAVVEYAKNVSGALGQYAQYIPGSFSIDREKQTATITFDDGGKR